MHSPDPTRSAPDLPPYPASEARELIAQARSLRIVAASPAGLLAAGGLLRDKNLGLLCDRVDSVDAALFRRAATALGARIAHIHPALSTASPPSQVQAMGRLLGRLYDAVECQGLDPALVASLRETAGVPVYDGIATPGHPSACLGDQLAAGIDT
ncbi:MAG: ornithine carbamoyltransferase, partial [Rubrivivax sp.]